MKRLLFCWELGANLGHLSVIRAVLPQLQAAGFETLFAVADVQVAQAFLGPGRRVLQAPVWPRHLHTGSRVGAVSYADVLALLGYADPSKLGAIVSAWLELIDLAQPTGLVIDHGPGAQLAARIAGLPVIVLGTGFTLPPLEYAEFPPLRADLAPAVPEPRLLQSADIVLRSFNGPLPPSTLPSLFTTAGRVVVGLPELDPYRSFRRETLYAPPGGYAPPGDPGEPLLFAYLGVDTPGLAEKVQVLASLEMPVDIYVRGGTPQILDFIRLRGKVAHDSPVNMKSMLQRATHLLSHAGAMTSSEGLAAGRPQFLLPLHQEGELNTTALVRAEFGRQSRGGQSADVFRRELEGFLADQTMSRRTLDFARVIAKRPMANSGDQLIGMLQKISAIPG